VKRIIPYLFSLAVSLPLLASNNGEEKFSLFADYNQIAQARFKNPTHRHRAIRFSEERAIGRYTHHIDDLNGMTCGVGYLGTQFHFSHRPKFNQKHFDNLLLEIGAYTKEIDKWRLDANLNIQMNTEHLSLSRYTFFTGLLHGQYKWHEKRNLHIGILSYSGMRYSRVLPVIGIDYKPSEKWKLNLIFPLNVSAVYSINSNWSTEVGLRYFLARQRLQDDDRLSRGLVAYRNWGAEAGINYKCGDRITFNAHVGESLGGRMRVSHRDDRHRHHYEIKSAPYFGLMAKIAF
jgi:hypothetical protein